MSGFNYLIAYGGGLGPDVWDAEKEISAVDIRDAIAQASALIEDNGGWIFSVQQNDYPPTTREKLESERDAARARIAFLEEAREVGFKHVDELLATNAALTRRLELIEWQNQERLTVTWNDLHGAFVVQGPRQVVGNMGRGQTVIEALDAARAKDGKGTA